MVNFRDSYFNVNWDLTTKYLRGTFWGKQYDTGRGFAVTVINGGQVVAPTNEVLRLKWEKPDKTTGYVNATIVNGKFIVENIDQMFTVHGSVRADFELSVGGEFVASITFYVNVEKAVAVDAIESSSDFTTLQDAVGSVDSLQQQFNNVVANVTVDSEVIAARGTEATLGARLDSTDVQLAEIASGEGLKDKSITPLKTTFFKDVTKNLFDKSTRTMGYYVNPSTGELVAYTALDTSDFISVLPNTTYTRSHDNRLAFYDADKVFISGISSGSGEFTFTTPSNAKYIKCSMTTGSVNSFQIELGSVSTTYEAYKPPIISKENLEASIAIDDDVTSKTQTWSSDKIQEGICDFYSNGEIHTRKTISTGGPNTHRIEISFTGNLAALKPSGGVIKTLLSVPPQELGHGEILLWDLKLNTLVIQTYSTAYDKTNTLLLAHVHNGVIKAGVLGRANYLIDDDIFLSAPVKYVDFDGEIDFFPMPTSGLRITFGDGVLTSWYESNKLHTRLYEMPQNVYELAHTDKLVWNLPSNTISVTSGTEIESSTSDVLLFYNNASTPKSGMLSYRYSPELEEVKKELSISPIYVKNMLYDVSKRVKEKQKIDTLSFGFITDTHINDYTFHHVNSLGKASTLVDLDYICHGGDLIDGSSERNIELNRISKAISSLSIGNTPVLFCKGNHDFNDIYNTANGGGTENLLTDLELYNYTNRFANDEVVWGSREKHYFYKDDEKSKIRSIFVNTSDLPYEVIDGEINYTTINEFAFSNEQLNWIAHEALNFTNKQGWSVIIIGHRAGMFGETSYTGVVHGWLLSGIVHSFKSGVAYTNSGSDEYGSWDIDVDFSTQGAGDFIAFLRGDRHYDEISVLDGLTHITTLNSRPVQKSWDPPTPERVQGTPSENAWDIVTIDKSKRKIYMTRFGAGEDREVDF